MKKLMLFTLSTIMSTSLMAQEKLKENGNQGGGRGTGSRCVADLKDDIEKRTGTDDTGVAKQIAPYAPKAESLSDCERYAIAASINGKELSSGAEAKGTADKRISCISKGGFTLDYDDCKRVLTAYNAVVLAEQGMFAAQSVMVNENNKKQNAEVAQAMQNGDGQGAALKAIEERNRQNAQMYKQQAMTYTTAVAALGTTLGAWDGKGKKAIHKACNKGKGAASAKGKMETYTGMTNYDAAMCESALSGMRNSSEIYANDDARNAFLMAGAEYFKKALEARRLAGLSEHIADTMPKPNVDEEEDVMLDQCVITPNDPACVVRGPRTSNTGNFKGNTIDFGSGSGNQAFNFDPTGTDDLGSDDPTKSGTPEKVGDISSPFENEAKAAGGILNPAGVASVSPGSANSAPGGGGGGGGGGGSASLGDDLAGAKADENKDPDINTNKVSGKYRGGNGGGFQAVGKSKEDANPFSSLFDAKGDGGGIEEDRSIASGDIDGQASGLFQKISNRYGEVQKAKRVESQNVE